MDQSEAKAKKSIGSRTLAFSLAMIMVMVAVCGSGAISYNASAASATTEEIDPQLVPHYRDANYILDPLETLQRWDSMGSIWNEVGTPEVNDSTLIMSENEGANVTVADWAHIDDGMHYEIRVKQSAVNGNTSMKLVGSATNYVTIGLFATGKLYCIYTNATAVVQNVSLMTTYVANTWYKLSIEFGTAQMAITACYDNDTVIGTSTVTDNSLDYDEIVEILLKQTVAAKIGTCDYFYQSTDRTDITAVAPTGADIRTNPNVLENYIRMKVDFGQAEMIPGTYSNDPNVHAGFGSTVATVPLSTDRYYNFTDFADVLGSTKEDKQPVTGIAKMRGWDNLQENNEQTLQAYLAKKHNVGLEQVSIVDYYVDDVKINYTWSNSLQEKVKDSWYSAMKGNIKDVGGELTFNKDRSVTQPIYSYADVKYVYFPAEVTQKQVDAMMKGVSNDMRQKTIGVAMLSPCDQANLSDPALFNLDMGGQYSVMSLDPTKTTGEGFDNGYQFTDAMIGEILSDSDSMEVDVETVQGTQNWTVVEDGKPVEAPATSMILFGSDLWLIIIFVVVIAIAMVILFFVLGKKKKKKG